MTLEIIIVLSILTAAIILFITEWVRVDVVALLVLSSLTVAGLVSPAEALSGFSNPAVVTVWAVLILSGASDRKGVAGLIGGLGPLAVMAGFFILAALTSQFMPNPAVAVLLAPIALSTASDLGISPYPLMMTVAVSASAAFLSPVGHSANVLVMGPGGYKFSDYLKIGIPLTLVVLAVVLLIMPIFWPF